MKRLATVLILAFVIRFIGINWDHGMHLHPDERMLIMVADRIHFFNQLNPDFFNYGSLPIYLLKGLSQFLDSIFRTHLATYDGMLYVGRVLSTSADLGVIVLIYLITNKIFKNKKTALYACSVYTFAFFPIQNSHFFIVDTFLNLFILGTIYFLLLYWYSPTLKLLLAITLYFAAALCTKITAMLFIPFLAGTIAMKHVKKSFGAILSHLVVFSVLLLCFSFLFMPYAYLNSQKFVSDVTAQIKLNDDPYVFPYTLQYVGTTSYFYYLKNIFLWGLGPISSLLSIGGIIILIKKYIIRAKSKTSLGTFLDRQTAILFLFLLFYFLYFLVIGRSAVKFMRYMLPLYPFFAIFAGHTLHTVHQSKYKPLLYPTLIALTMWTMMFTSMYLKEHTRISATKWILANIQTGSRLAVEHWDDRLPLYGGERYEINELQLYNQPDDTIKWQIIKNALNNSDYLIIASNRLYIPLQKLASCKKYKVCYPNTSKYYEDLFAGRLPFKKVAEFEVRPGFSDLTADESFTVYDHPKIIIFKNTHSALLL